MNPFIPESVQEHLILASASPRRRELLRGLGIPFEVDISDYRERAGDDADAIALANALGKAGDVAKRRPGALVIGADTIVVLGSDPLGKPANAVEGAAMLARLSGRSHAVITGVALVRYGAPAGALESSGDSHAAAPPGRESSCVSRTEVRFRELRRAEIDAYLASGEPFDKAGAYGIQGLASQFVTGIDGCYFNVMGLPLELLTRMLVEWEA